MRTILPVSRLEPPLLAAVQRLFARAEVTDPHTPLADYEWRRIAATGGQGFAAVIALDEGGEGDSLFAYAQAWCGPAETAYEAQLVLEPAHRGELVDLGSAMLAALLREVAQQGGGEVHLWAVDAGPAHAELAARVGMDEGRTLWLMHRPLPVGAAYEELPLRPFRVGVDEEEWLEVNRLAFAEHPSQGAATLEQLLDRERQPWFDPEGFLVLELEGRMAGFCWTKLFTEAEPAEGEIHVIGVHPDFHGRGLGRSLVLSGLDHLHRRGAQVGMLFVEGTNEAAKRLYEGLGFSLTRTDRSYVAKVRPA